MVNVFLIYCFLIVDFFTIYALSSHLIKAKMVIVYFSFIFSVLVIFWMQTGLITPWFWLLTKLLSHLRCSVRGRRWRKREPSWSDFYWEQMICGKRALPVENQYPHNNFLAAQVFHVRCYCISNFAHNTSHKITSHWPSHIFCCLVPLYSLLFGSGKIVLTCSDFLLFCLSSVASFSYSEQRRNKSHI